ncbi:MAG: hypothetical protein JW889_06625 [Verrucomicrobia bacterium]|nr:hypothetical protein [Verrucomicrobiota bacterium]
MFCDTHGIRAEYTCRMCGRLLCERCTKLVVTGPSAIRVCPVCGGHVAPCPEEARNLSDRSYWSMLATVLVWPLTLRGLVVVVLNAAFISLLVGMAYLTSFSAMGVFLGLFLVLFAYGYGFLLFLNVIQKTALGEAETPTTPEVSGFGEAFVALARMFVVLLVWTAPAMIAYHAAEGQITPLFWMAAGIGGAFLPMSLLAVAVFESLRGINPVPLFLSMVRVPAQYAACCLFFFLVIGARHVICSLDSITELGFAGTLIRNLVMVYSLFVLGRLVGGLHAANSLRFGWVRA